jgi:hypothetical protein
VGWRVAEVVRVLESKGVGYAVEEGEDRSDVHTLGNLRVGPAQGTKGFDVSIRRAVRVLRDQLDEPQQATLGFGHGRAVELGPGEAFMQLGFGVLQLQEEGVAAYSVRATVQSGNIGCDHLLQPARQMSFGEMQALGEADHVLEEVRAQAHALEDAGKVRPAGVGRHPGCVHLGGLAGCLVLLDPSNSRHGLPHVRVYNGIGIPLDTVYGLGERTNIMSISLIVAVTLVGFGTPAGSAANTAADAVTLKDGQVALGRLVEPAPRGKVVLVVRRAWAEAHLPDWAKRWEAAETAWVKRARHERRDRLVAWRTERTPQAPRGDAIVNWLNSEITRLADGAAAPSPLMAVQLAKADVKTSVRKPSETGRLLNLGWQAGFNDVETMPVDELKQALEGKGFAVNGTDPVPLDALLPIMPEADAHWQVRRAATEVANDAGLRLIRFQSFVYPEDANGAQAPASAALLLSSLKDLLDDKPAADPLATALRGLAAKGHTGAVVTRLDLASDLASVTVESTLWVRRGPDQWTQAVTRSATVRPDALAPNAGQPLAADPQVKGVLSIVDALGLGQMAPGLKERGLNAGAATQQALGAARAALKDDLNQLELPVSATPAPMPAAK